MLDYLRVFTKGRRPRIASAVGIPEKNAEEQIRQVQRKGRDLFEKYLDQGVPLVLPTDDQTRRKRKHVPASSLWEPLKRRIEEMMNLSHDPDQPTYPLRRCKLCRRAFTAINDDHLYCSRVCRNENYYEERKARTVR